MAENGNRTGKVGKGNPPKDKQFSKENQPSGEAKSKGWKKKRELKDLANALITGDAKKNAAATAQLVGIDLSDQEYTCLLYTSPSPRDATLSRMPSSA